jgi:transcriptional regulator with XRE-family HTH domain
VSERLRKALGKRLRVRRLSLGLSQEALAEKCGLHRTYLGGLERGERNPTLDIIERVAHALGIRPGKLLDGEDLS